MSLRPQDLMEDDVIFHMSLLNTEEFTNLKFPFGTSSWGGTRKLPRIFTEQGVAMLSSVLRSKRAAQVNIQIIRAFDAIRALMSEEERSGLSREI